MYVKRGRVFLERGVVTFACLAVDFGRFSRYSTLPWIGRIGRARLCRQQGIHGEGLYVDDKELEGRYGVFRREARLSVCLCPCVLVYAAVYAGHADVRVRYCSSVKQRFVSQCA